VDPVVKIFQSGYNCFSDNPIIKVDKKGDDDYYMNDKGQLLGIFKNSSSSDNFFKVTNAKMIEYVYTEAKTVPLPASGTASSTRSAYSIWGSCSDFNRLTDNEKVQNISVRYFGDERNNRTIAGVGQTRDVRGGWTTPEGSHKDNIDEKTFGVVGSKEVTIFVASPCEPSKNDNSFSISPLPTPTQTSGSIKLPDNAQFKLNKIKITPQIVNTGDKYLYIQTTNVTDAAGNFVPTNSSNYQPPATRKPIK
jgi:hypothetical protein